MNRRTMGTGLLSLLIATPAVFGQTTAGAAPAAPTLPSQKILIHVHSSDPKDAQAALAKANEIMSNAKPGSTLVEVLATGDGLKLVNKQESLSSGIDASLDKDVSFIACHASMRTAHMTPDQLHYGVGMVPSGSRELALRKANGWVVIDDKSIK